MGTSLTQPACAHCGGKNVKLRAQKVANGTLQFAWRCLDCNRWAEKPARWLPHTIIREELKRWDVKAVDILVKDYSARQTCEIENCNNPGEVHHWAPRAYRNEFGDEWPLWPTIILCKQHHDLWHRVVTPQLVYGEPKDNEISLLDQVVSRDS